VAQAQSSIMTSLKLTTISETAFQNKADGSMSISLGAVMEK
jgi:hypothetical protein